MNDQKYKDDKTVGVVVNLATNCREFRCLPGPGSLLEQDSLLIYLINIVQAAWAEREKRDQDEAKKSKSRG
jgi:hypothetical protein